MIKSKDADNVMLIKQKTQKTDHYIYHINNKLTAQHLPILTTKYYLKRIYNVTQTSRNSIRQKIQPLRCVILNLYFMR